MTRLPRGLPALSPLSAAFGAIGVIAIAATIGRISSPTPDHARTRRWYERLDKPGFTPPAPAYAMAWAGIETALAYGGYTLLRSPPSPERSAALASWAGNQIGVAGWNAIFFGGRSPGWGAMASGALGVVGATHVATAARVSRPAALAGIPFVAWIGFATLLAEEIWRRN